MIAKLEFDMNEPEDRAEHAAMLQTQDLRMAIWELDQTVLRSIVKYDSMALFDQDPEWATLKSKEEIAIFVTEKIRAALWDEIQKRGITDIL